MLGDVHDSAYRPGVAAHFLLKSERRGVKPSAKAPGGSLVDSATSAQYRKIRGDLLRQYVQLQRDIMESDPSSSAYHATIRSFRQMGQVLISAGFEEDLDRLLRLRIIEGERPARRSNAAHANQPELHVLERRVSL